MTLPDKSPGNYRGLRHTSSGMLKRRRSEDRDYDDATAERAAAKKRRTGPRRNLLDISDELVLRILSHLSTRDLLRSER